MIELQPKQREAARDPVSPKKSCGHALIADALRHCGVKRVVGITGTPVDQIFSECAARGIRPIGARPTRSPATRCLGRSELRSTRW